MERYLAGNSRIWNSPEAQHLLVLFTGLDISSLTFLKFLNTWVEFTDLKGTFPKNCRSRKITKILLLEFKPIIIFYEYCFVVCHG